MSEVAKEGSKLTTAQKARIERNRVKALNIRQSKIVAATVQKKDAEANIIKVQGTKYVDSGGGFLLEQEVLPGTSAASAGQNAQTATPQSTAGETISIPVTYEECLECGGPFADSYLFNNFTHAVCDKCRDNEERHALITRTEAKAEYLLKDCDFDRREPPLRFISRKNPHNMRWGEMKLYLHSQVVARAMEVWGSEEALMEQHENRKVKGEISKVRKYNKQMKQLRMEMRSSIYTKELKGTHVHEFGPDTYNEEEDTYTHTCQTCPYTETYEKL